MKSTIIVLALTTLSSCAGLVTERTFINQMDKETDGLFVAGRDFTLVSGDTGVSYRTRREIDERTPYNERELESIGESYSLDRELARKEMRLSAAARTQYRHAAAYLNTTSEKIYFLNLSYLEREEYLESRKVRFKRRANRQIASVGESPSGAQGLFLGMTKSGVISAWGRPERVDVAGNPNNENERWAFRGVSSTHYVYFENGLVQGWKTR